MPDPSRKNPRPTSPPGPLIPPHGGCVFDRFHTQKA